jgi:hypothetical protein
LKASKLPTAPYWMSGLAAMSMSKGGAIEIAQALWRRQYEESDREDVRENARNHILSFRIAKDLLILEFSLKKFHDRTGSFPKSLQVLQRGEDRECAIVDPSGVPYAYDPKTGEVRLNPTSRLRYLKVPESYRQQIQSAIHD